MRYVLQTKVFLWLLLTINIVGTIYGYIWYGNQLKETNFPFVLFVPDSPTASLFFCLVLISFLLGENWGLMESLAVLSLVKYGIWAVVMNLLLLYGNGSLSPLGIMLMISHFLMAVQAFLYLPNYRIETWHWVVGSVWLLHNDFLDYVLGIMPYYSFINDYPSQVGYFTFWLSIATILLSYKSYNQINKGQTIHY